MNSAKSKSRAFANGSPWSDNARSTRSTPSRKPPRSPPRKLVYDNRTVSSPAFDFSSIKSNNEKKSSKNRNETQASKSSTNTRSENSNGLAETKPETPKEEEQINTGCDKSTRSTLSASTPVFVPSQVTLAALKSPESADTAEDLGSHSRSRPRLPAGIELKQMVKVLLDIINQSKDNNDDPSPKKSFQHLYPHLLTSKAKSHPTQSRTSHGTSGTFSRIKNLVSVRRRTQSA